MKKNIILIISIFLFSINTVYAKEATIKGTFVKDSSGKEVLKVVCDDSSVSVDAFENGNRVQTAEINDKNEFFIPVKENRFYEAAVTPVSIVKEKEYRGTTSHICVNTFVPTFKTSLGMSKKIMNANITAYDAKGYTRTYRTAYCILESKEKTAASDTSTVSFPVESGKIYEARVRVDYKKDGKTYIGRYTGYKGRLTVKPSITKLTAKSKKITVTYKKTAGSGYVIYVSRKKEMSSPIKISVSNIKTLKTVTPALKSGTYYVRMRSYITHNNAKYYGQYSDIKSIKF